MYYLRVSTRMEKENEIRIFEDKQVRTLWDAEQEKWYISNY